MKRKFCINYNQSNCNYWGNVHVGVQAMKNYFIVNIGITGTNFSTRELIIDVCEMLDEVRREM